MDARHDALLAAAEIALLVERRGRLEPGLLGTVGRFEVPEGAINVIPRRCELSLDVRAQDDEVLTRAHAGIPSNRTPSTHHRHVPHYHPHPTRHPPPPTSHTRTPWRATQAPAPPAWAR